MRNLMTACLLSGALFLGAGPAWAHAHLEKAAPSVGGRVKAPPAEIRLWFSEGVEPHFCKVALATAAGKELKLGTPATAPGDAKLLVAKVPETLAAGTYRVTWHAVSVDTHKTQGSFTFTVAP
jgi:copper resistance protein C